MQRARSSSFLAGRLNACRETAWQLRWWGNTVNQHMGRRLIGSSVILVIQWLSLGMMPKRWISAMTSYAMKGHRDRCMDAGMDG